MHKGCDCEVSGHEQNNSELVVGIGYLVFLASKAAGPDGAE